MRVRRDVLCVLTACSAFAGVVPGPVQAGEPFDVFILAVD